MLLTKNTEVERHDELTMYLCSFSFYRGADKSLARPTSRCILFDAENTAFDASLVMYT